jgi:hypothetical protein
MQMYWNSAFTSRMVFNASKAYVRQLKEGEYYDMLQPVYGLAILNDYIVPKDETTSFYHHYEIVNREDTDDVIKGMEFVLVELPKFKPETCVSRIKFGHQQLVELPKFKPETWAEKKMAVLWLRFLREVDEKATAIDKELLDNEEINRAVELCQKGAFTPEELAAYENYWDRISIEVSTSRSSLARGIVIGDANGWARGEEKRIVLEKNLSETEEALENERAEKEKALAEKEKALAAKENERAEKENERAEKEKALAEKDKERAEKEAALAELAELKRLLKK